VSALLTEELLEKKMLAKTKHKKFWKFYWNPLCCLGRVMVDHHWTRILCIYSAGVCPFHLVASFKFGNHKSNPKSVERRGRFRFISFSFRWFRFVSFRFCWFRFVSFLFRFALYRYPFVLSILFWFSQRISSGEDRILSPLNKNTMHLFSGSLSFSLSGFF
jgi:hypothetical protein